jgi:hypothetical protein
MKAYKHVFTSPSSVDQDEPRATKSGNARIHGMTSVTKASLSYIATQVSPRPISQTVAADHILQVRFALCSTSTFSRTDSVTDSENFYNSLLDLLYDIEEKEEVQDLLQWWDR